MSVAETLMDVFNHIAFPPKLPGKKDREPEKVERDLIIRLRSAVQTLYHVSDDAAKAVWESILLTLEKCSAVNQNGMVNKFALLDAFGELHPGGAVIVNIGEQNAALLIRIPQNGDHVVIEAFETSPSAEETLAASGALRWTFPGTAVSLSVEEFKNPVLQASLTDFLEKASTEQLEQFAAKARKAGKEVVERRNTVDPSIITEFLIALLGVNGSHICPPALQKRVKDDVCWDNAELPWRRSPFWLVLRVSIQRLLYLRLGSDLGRLQYKFLLCFVLAELLGNVVDRKVLEPEQWSWLNTKLCRRLAKLETEMQTSSTEMRTLHAQLSQKLDPVCQQSVTVMRNAISGEWEEFKKRIQRKIPQLPIYAKDTDFVLSLPNSISYLENVMRSLPGTLVNRPRTVDPFDVSSHIDKNTGDQFVSLVKKYSPIAETELDIEFRKEQSPMSEGKSDEVCLDTARQITCYLDVVGQSHDSDHEQMSSFILNVLELWVLMDKCATSVYPLICEYRPVFCDEQLDVLLLSRYVDLERLQKIQLYLQDRCTAASRGDMTIFSDPAPGCFADRFLGLPIGRDLVQLQRKIEKASSVARALKESELADINEEFESLTRSINNSICTQRRHPDGTHDIRGCSHCYYVRCRRRLEITIHEDYLPTDEKLYETRAIVFELRTPKVFSAYRSATWTIINRFSPTKPATHEGSPQMMLRQHKPYSVYLERSNGGLTLASSTKSHLKTHYKSKSLPASESSILRPFGLTFHYYDSDRRLWAKCKSEPLTIAHHFVLSLPPSLPFAKLYSSPSFAPSGSGPSSYEAIATMRECPPTVTVHEFLAHQALMSGKHRRWLTILTELGSSNINLSSLDAMVLLHHLALQVGPQLQDDPFRVVHAIFKDVQFCRRLLEQIDQHVSIIAPNWREVTYMETMLTLTIQVHNLGCQASRAEAGDLLLKIRRITLKWIDHLQMETRNALQLDIEKRGARYCVLAALLCRRTFFPQAYAREDLDAESFQCFIEATLAMQECFVLDISKFDNLMHSMLVRDIKMSVRLRPIVHAAVKLHPRSIASAIDKVWPTSATRQFAVWQSLPHPHELWVTTESRATEHTLPQIIHLHILEGHFLVDGKPLGKLPADIRDSEELKELFGDQRLTAFPSNRPGMSYTLAINKEGCQIHLGYRGKALVIQATTKGGSVLEHIPRRIFSEGQSFDLPEPLVRDCVHWLDLGTGILEARRMPAIWIPRPANWKLNIKTRKAQRNKKSYLVDPNSSLATAIANIFLHFERPSMLTIYQPPVKELSVELKRMNLTFHVNRRKLLQCPQLGAEIDPDQDAGTFYGLQSMLVLRNVHNRSQRSIITPLGKIHYQRHGIHVLVRKENDGFYARYVIDDILGRIHGPAEPRLLYTLAQLHAHTSFIMTDPLTARTGTEEALHILESAHAQPWSPLYPGFRELLQTISYLTPSRQYYPKGLKCLQVINWNPALTTSIQHEAYRPIVNSILSRSHKLSLFQIGGAHHQPQQATNEPHLSARAHWRRSLYERTDASCQPISITSDTPYLSQVGCFMSKRISNVREIVTLLRERPPVLRTTQNLASLLGKWSSIGSFNSKFASTTIQETLSLDLSLKWGMLVRLCTECERKDVYHLMFHLGLIAYDKGVNMDMLRVLAAFFILPDLKRIELPSHPSFEGFPDDKPPDVETIITLARPFCKEYQNLAEQKPNFSKWHQSMYKKAKTERANHEKKCMAESESFALSILKEWPCFKPSATSFSGETLDVDSALEVVSPDWLRRFKNFQLSNFVQDAQTVLDAYSAPTNPCSDDDLTPKPEEFWGGFRWTTKVTLHLDQDLISKPGPEMVPTSSFPMLFNHEEIADQASSPNPSTRQNYKGVREPEIAELEQIVRRITDSGSSVRSTYGQDLQLSIVALRDKDQQSMSVHATKTHYLVEMARYDAEIRNARAVVHQIYRQICDKLSAGDARHPWMQRGNIWPCITQRTILQQLRKTASTNFGPNMQQALITYGLSIVHLQRLVRMKELFAKHDQSRLEQERSCSAHASWNYMEYPDWILLEIDGNVQIRQEQVTVALEMVSPTSGSNSVLQMNMGQGKTSVIMPMVACALADCNNLVRLLVPKALTAQTAQVLQDRLGGLVGKELMHIPFSRRTPTNLELIGEYRSLHEKMSSKAGIILGVPEHALSFKLSGLQRVSDLKLAEAAEMIRTQEWIDSIGRDILDECDYTLAVKTQLIYPSGSQLAVDGNPDRWEAIMGVLGLVAQHVRDLAPVFPQSIDVVERPLCSFPLVFLLRRDVEVALTERIVQDICLGRGSILPVQSFDITEQEAIKRFISRESVDSSAAKFIEYLFRDAPRACKRTYLLRGLFVHQILLLCLKKRWNVQYGLHPGRDPMAVPFQAKGVPSDYAEWGHPDVAILFTCLAFYHEGLSQEQCRRCLQAVLKSDDPATEYDRLTQTSDLPEALRHWNLINVDDQGQVSEFWHIMRFSMVMINYFLKQFVFPVHAKQFAVKLQTSGWDVPFNSTVSARGAKRNGAGLTTGFSGTNDNRRLLPLTIEQHDLPELLHTNAEVLTYLLQSRNREYRPAFSDGGRMSEAGLLLDLATSEIRVLIDAGALILEMDNLTLVKTWLEKDTKAQAAVYFGTDNKPWVWYRIGKNAPLLATPYADNLQNCLIYLDEAHTRGTDLKLPADAKGALTLGLNQTKDHTVQAAMRLRQLGTTQSIIFVAPPEVHQSILDVNQRNSNDKIDSSHVVYWLLHQTCASNAELEPLFHAQGVDFCRRIQAASEFPEFLENTEHRDKYMAILQQPEQQTLEELYKPRICGLGDKGKSSMATLPPATGKVAVYLEQLHHRRHQSDLMQSAITSSALEEVEQEREVAYEIEEEREVQRPQRLQAYGFPGLHPALSQFAMTGQLQEFGTLTAANVLHESQLSLKFGMKNSNLVPHLLVSHEFTRTVKSKHRIGDEFTRSVNWLLYNTKNETAIVIIPEEAEALIPILRTCAAPSTHLITYAAPVTRRMLHFEKLDYYTTPPLSSSHTLPAWLSFELGILAGRLYFGYTEYEVITEHLQLGLEWLDASNPASRGLANQMSFVQEWLALRRQGQDISHTPMGYICQRRPLRVDHPFFANAITKKGDHLLPSSGYMTGTKEEEYYDSDEDDAGGYEMVDDETFQDNHEQHGDVDEPEFDKVDDANNKAGEDGEDYQNGEERNCQLQ
ncbi:hypothetical protein BO79DRAFT_246177 [Aspergillus costaricaensis CBS 115574]|uniref:Uncharacterized protein n=1 Tax=Aspergillus costaricaensis CBS 115574 TaxID=1448317 RepID=A0ACD1IAM9_9EURO|nr:hypothetical protein BO79DRAFT_246177 [Aspergillus costaricaensis CBS 115574]RAK87649.1 hypothetical protein BO79DRAFT_246177 [Aspergillus costaricaensis CBS 115574]